MKEGDKNPIVQDSYESFIEGKTFIPLSFLDAISEGILVHDYKGDITICNEAAQTILDLTCHQLMDKSFMKNEWEAYHEDGTRFNCENFPMFMGLRSDEPASTITLNAIRPGKESVWISINSKQIIDQETGDLVITVTSFHDISAAKQAADSARISERKWRSVLNTTKSGIFLIDEKYNLTLSNTYGKQMLNLFHDFEEFKNPTSFIDLLPEHRRGPVSLILENAFKGLPTEYEILYKKNDGNDLWILANYAPVKAADNKVIAVCIVASNITALKKKEDALLKSEQRWKFALDGAGDGVWEYNYITHESYYSPLYKTMLGYTDDEFKNEMYEWRDRVHPDDYGRIMEIDAQYERNERQNHSIEYRIKHKSGDYLWVLDRGMLLEKTPEGKPLKVIGTHKNITESKLAEQHLIQSQQRFRSFMSNTPTMSWIVDENAVVRYLNEPYREAFKLKESDIGKTLYDIFPLHICNLFIENNWKVWEKGSAIEVVEEGVGPDGNQQFYHIFKFPLEPENGVRMLGGVALDITKKIQAEQQEAAYEEKRKREIIQAIIDAQEKERKEIAYELHDNVNQILSSSKLMLEVAAEKPEMSSQFVARSLKYLNEAMIEIRKISHSITPATLRDISLQAAIDEVVVSLNLTGKLQITYVKNLADSEKGIEAEIQLSVLRIAQEQLNNIIKHAGASEAVVVLDISSDLLSLTITDNGKGFDPLITRKGLGLNNIINRVEYFHGNFQLDSSDGKGCSLHIEIPLFRNSSTYLV